MKKNFSVGKLSEYYSCKNDYVNPGVKFVRDGEDYFFHRPMSQVLEIDFNRWQVWSSRTFSGDDWLYLVINVDSGEVLYESPISFAVESYFERMVEEEEKGDEDDEDEIDESFDGDYDGSGVTRGDTFIEDGVEYEWVQSCSDVVNLDFDSWQVWEAVDDNLESSFFVVDVDTGFIDWGPCDTQEEAQEFLEGKVSDWEDDESFVD